MFIQKKFPIKDTLKTCFFFHLFSISSNCLVCNCSRKFTYSLVNVDSNGELHIHVILTSRSHEILVLGSICPNLSFG